WAHETVRIKSTNSLDTTTTPEHPFYTRYREPYRNGYRTKEERDCQPEWTEAKDLTKRHYTGSILPPEKRCDYSLDDLWLMGRYVADGHMRKSRWTEGKYEEMNISLGKHKEEDFAAKAVGKYTISNREGTALKAIFYGHNVIEKFAQFGGHAHTKFLPHWVLSLPKDQAKAFLEGYVSGDGHHHEKRVETVSVSPRLSLGIALLMQRITGKCPALGHIKAREKCVIEGREVNNRPQVRAAYPTANYRLRNYVCEDGIAWGHVRLMQRGLEGAEVFNLSVEDDESYVANGVIVHNCTRLANSGARWLDKPAKNPVADCTPEEAEAWPRMTDEEKIALTWKHLEQGAALFSAVWNADHIPLRAIENPVMHKHAKARITNFRPHSQSVQPWHFGTEEDGPDNEKKRTCFWLVGLPLLRATGTLDGTTARDTVHKTPPGKNRAELRSKFFPGMAAAMADQWGRYAEITLAKKDVAA
ncbi:hypothetical protein, partial [Pseudophaeobacter arcticus]|uniref:hypothetical protein n=1 Tax=Pseudophaeobacter arcticus TaxID=385492 RepID=UPI0024921DCB